MTCKHEQFDGSIKVAGFENTGGHMAEIRIKCRQCGIPFQFLGLEPGIDLHGARVSVDGLEALIAICPQGSKLSPLDRIAVNFGSPGKVN